MPASSPSKDKGSRPQKYAQIGELGRMTGIEAPKNVPRDSGGYERPEDFFDDEAADDDYDDGRIGNNARRQQQSSPRRASGKGSQQNARAAGQASSAKKAANGAGAQDRRHQDRPDQYAEPGIRGRKTGRRAPSVRRDDDGFEDVDEFFRSSPTSAKSSVKKQYGRPRSSVSPIRKRRDNNEDDDEDDEEDDDQQDDFDDDLGGQGTETMDFDDGSSATPRTYQQRMNASSSRKSRAGGSSSPASKGASSARKVSVAKAGERKGSSALAGRRSANGALDYSSEDDNDEEVADLVARQLGSGSKKNKQRAESPVDRDQREDSFVDYNDYGGGGEGEPAQYSDGDDEEQYRNDENVDPRGADEDEEERAEDDEDDAGSGGKRAKKAAASRKGKGKGTARGAPAKTKRSRQAAAADSAGPSKRRRTEKDQQSQVMIERFDRNNNDDDDSDEDIDGLRRSSRRKLAPLEYWRNERVIYKKRPSGIGIEGVVRIAKDSPQWAQRNKRGGSAKATVKRARSNSRVKSEVPEEEGVDDMTDEMGIVWNWENDAEVKRRIAFTAKMVDPRPTFNSKFSFQKIYTELDYMAAGILQIPSGIEKPPKPARDNSYMFYCIEGSVMVTVHRTRFAIGPGGTFFVPRGNMYSILATSDRDVKLFFTQGRRVYEAPDGTSYPDDADHEQHLARAEEAARGRPAPIEEADEEDE